MGDSKGAREKAKVFEKVDMAEVWKKYANNVQKHLEVNRRVRVHSMDPKRARYYA